MRCIELTTVRYPKMPRSCDLCVNLYGSITYPLLGLKNASGAFIRGTLLNYVMYVHVLH